MTAHPKEDDVADTADEAALEAVREAIDRYRADEGYMWRLGRQVQTLRTTLDRLEASDEQEENA